jgi:hypothetical protein
MAWAYYAIADGRLVSISTIDTPAPNGYERVDVGVVDLATQMWDSASHTFVTRPVKQQIDRLAEILTHPDYGDDIQALWSTLNATNRTRLRNGLIRLLGRHRFRNVAETLTVP